jgi:hypothetical protein
MAIGKSAGEMGGNIIRNIAEEAGEQLTKRAPKTAEPVSDWGWKGAKPGEISGKEFMQNEWKLSDEIGYNNLGDDDAAKIYRQQRGMLYDKFHRQLANSSNELLKARASRYGIDFSSNPSPSQFQHADEYILQPYHDIAYEFWALENAGFPRVLTGKALGQAGPDSILDDETGDITSYALNKVLEKVSSASEAEINDFAALLSNPNSNIEEALDMFKHMAFMTDEAKQSFLRMYPSWKGWGGARKKDFEKYNALTEVQRTLFEGLAPTWNGGFEDLIDISRILTGG